jgi:hypothetical protein
MSIEMRTNIGVAEVPDILDDLLTRTPGAGVRAAALESIRPVPIGRRTVDIDPLCQEYSYLAAWTYTGSEDWDDRRETYLNYMHIAQQTISVTPVVGTPHLSDGFPDLSNTRWDVRFEHTINSALLYFLGTMETPDLNPATKALADVLRHKPPHDPRNIGLAAIGYQMGIYMAGHGQRKMRLLEQDRAEFLRRQANMWKSRATDNLNPPQSIPRTEHLDHLDHPEPFLG